MLTNEMLLKSGVQYEEYVVSFLKELTFHAKKTGNNDGGIDIVRKNGTAGNNSRLNCRKERNNLRRKRWNSRQQRNKPGKNGDNNV